MSKKDSKISVLTRIRDAKDILFGQFSVTLTKEKKVEEWKKICKFSKSLGLISEEKDYSYVRDVFWSNIKRATLAKKDNANQTGSAGGRIKKYTPIDEIVIEIIDSPILKGIGVKDTMADNLSPAEMLNSQNDIAGTQDLSKHSQVNTTQKKLKRLAINSTSHEEEEEISLKKRKLELKLEFFALKNYKMKLEILEMERRLNVPHSDFTSGILTAVRNIQTKKKNR